MHRCHFETTFTKRVRQIVAQIESVIVALDADKLSDDVGHRLLAMSWPLEKSWGAAASHGELSSSPDCLTSKV